jgi:hypothetical protein
MGRCNLPKRISHNQKRYVHFIRICEDIVRR